MPEQKLKELSFCFENLECYTVPAEYIESFSLVGLHENLSYHGGNSVLRMSCVKEALVMLKPEADTHAVSSFLEETTKGLFDRLWLYDDCVGIDITYTDGTKQEIYVPWEDGENEYKNKLQQTFFQNNKLLNGFGCFCVYLGKKKRLLKLFLEE